MEDWHRHGLFSQVAMQFRMAVSGQLLAGDFVQWLLWLRQRGAQGLQMIEADALGLDDRQCLGGIVVGFSDSSELWADYPEPTEAAVLEDGPADSPWAAELDCYWLQAGPMTAPPLMQVDWQALRSQAESALEEKMVYGAVKLGDGAAAPYMPTLAGEWADWQRLPLVPFGASNTAGHGLLSALHEKEAGFRNYAHPKNDSSDYWLLDEDARAAWEAWHAELEVWRRRVEIALANACVEKGIACESVPMVQPTAEVAELTEPATLVGKRAVLPGLMAVAVLSLLIVGAGYLAWCFSAH
ncbi:hypothetical protein [Chromobacterium amazonense]|uniref:Uncharacterized protein n=1 Tax=Chromobacterium amazonense TaxID=1382803 RepID=A0ABU8V620_9NEIS|nr:hypothetical protein [Chromobacterium amazonense]MDQ4541255.1 hypothetical protein [Chromobacterium amazonense]